MKGPYLVVVILVVAGAAAAWWFVRNAPPDERAVSDAADVDTPSDGGTSEPALHGAGPLDPDEADAKKEEDPLAHVLKRMASADSNERHAAFRRLQELYREGKVPLERLVDWALGKIGGGLDFVRWARETLRDRKPESLAFVPQILEYGLGASEARQHIVADVIGKLDAIRAEDVPLVVKLFEHEKTGYGLKRELVDVMDELGPAVLPLAPHLMDWITKVLKDRQVQAKEAAEAGISVSWDHVEFDVERLLGGMGDDAVPVLIERIQSAFARGDTEDDGARAQAWEPAGLYADALVASGERGLQALIGMLATADADDRTTLINALTWVDGPNETVREVLLRLLGDGDAWARAVAADALAKHGPASIPALVGALNDADAGVRRKAAQSLKALKARPADTLDALRKLLEGKDRRAALQAAETIAGFGADGLPALPQLIHLLRDDWWGWTHVAAAVGKLGQHRPAAMRDAYDAESSLVRLGLVLSVQSMPRPFPGEVTRLLEGALRSEDARIRVQAAHLLIRQGHKDALAPLIDGFDAEDPYVRIVATAGLAYAGERAAHLLPRILERVRREDLARAGPNAAGASRDRLSEANALDRAIEALGRYDMARMFELIDHEEFDVYYAAQQAIELAGIEGLRWLEKRWDGASASKRIAMLGIAKAAWYDRGDDPQRWAAAKALARRGLKAKEKEVREKAVDALEADPAEAGVLLPVLVDLIRGGSFDAAYDLSRLGAKAAPVEADLRAMLSHPDEAIRGYIRTVLDAIEDARKKDG